MQIGGADRTATLVSGVVLAVRKYSCRSEGDHTMRLVPCHSATFYLSEGRCHQVFVTVRAIS